MCGSLPNGENTDSLMSERLKLKAGSMVFCWRTQQRPRSEMSCTSSFAHRPIAVYEWLQKNPISLVRQSAKRKKTPDVLEAEELKKLLAELQNPARALVFLTAATGLRGLSGGSGPEVV